MTDSIRLKKILYKPCFNGSLAICKEITNKNGFGDCVLCFLILIRRLNKTFWSRHSRNSLTKLIFTLTLKLSTLTGSNEERTVFRYALTRDYSRDEEEKNNRGTNNPIQNGGTTSGTGIGGTTNGTGNGGRGGNNTETTNNTNNSILPLPQISMRIEEVHLSSLYMFLFLELFK